MKIALIGPVYPYRGGIAHYTSMLCETIRKQGHTLKIISFKRQYPQRLFPGKTDKDTSKQKIYIDDVDFLLDSLNPISWISTFKQIVEFKPDRLVLQWWTLYWSPIWFIFGLLNHLILKAPLVFIIHNVFQHEQQIFDKWITKLVLVWGDRFSVQSNDERNKMLSLFPQKKIRVIPHPVYDMFVDEKFTKEQAKKELYLPESTILLLFFGIVRKYKGLYDLLFAFPGILKETPHAILLIAGEFWDNKQQYLDVIHKLGIDQKIIIDDRYIPNEDVAKYFVAADVLMAPYNNITGSGVIQMAKGFGLPIMFREDIMKGNPSQIIKQKMDEHFHICHDSASSWEDLEEFITLG